MKRFFQWIDGNLEKISEFSHTEEDEGEIYLVFKDGERVNQMFVANLNETDLTNKYVAEIEGPHNKWGLDIKVVGKTEEVWETNAEGLLVCVQPAYEGKTVKKLIPPKKTNLYSRNENIPDVAKDNVILDNDSIAMQKLSQKADVNDPVIMLMQKAKKDDVDIQFNINIKIPDKNFYNLLKSTIDDDIDEKFFTHIIEDMDTNLLKDSLKHMLFEFYNDKLSNDI